MSRDIDNLISFEYVDDEGNSEEAFAFRISRPMTNEEVLKEYKDLNLAGDLFIIWSHQSCLDREEFWGNAVASMFKSFDGELNYTFLGISELLRQAAAGEELWPAGTWFVGSIYWI